MKIGPSKHGDLDDRTGTLAQTPVDLSKTISDMAILEGDDEICNNTPGEIFTMSEIKTLDETPAAPEYNKPRVSFTMSVIETVDEAPTAPESNDAVEGDLLDADDCSSSGQPWSPSSSDDGLDEPWIPVPKLVKKNMVEVEIYGAQESFSIDKSMLCSKSTYFETALKGGFLEAKTNKFLLVERLDLFQVFYYWLEQGNLDFMNSKDWIESAEDILVAFVEIYSFADRRGVPVLGDQILQKLDKRIRPGGMPARLDVNIINLAWEQLPESSGLCRYLLAIEHDANRCNLPERPGFEYGWLSGYFTAALLKTTKDDSEWWLTAKVQKQPVDIQKLHKYINRLTTGVDKIIKLDDRHWDKICETMNIKAPDGCDKSKLRGHLRAMYRRWLRPWDTALTPGEINSAEEECPRPFAKEFFHGAVVVEKTKLKPIRIRPYSNNSGSYYSD